MAGIVYKTIIGPVVPVEVTRSLTESNYTAVTPGTKTLYMKTGAGVNDQIRYGLTTDVSASLYSPRLSATNGATYYIGRQTTYTSESWKSSSYTEEYTHTDTGTSESTQASTRESYYYNNAVIQTTSSTSYADTYNNYANQYVFEFTSKDIGGGLIYRTLTLTSTRYYSGGKYYYFSTGYLNTQLATANGLTYQWLRNEAATYSKLNPPAEKYWYLNPTNNLAYSYAAGYTVSGLKTTATTSYITAKMSASMLLNDNADKPTGITGTYRYGGGYAHKSSLSRTHYSRSYTGTSSSYVGGYSRSDGVTGCYDISIGYSIFTKLSNRANSVSYASTVLYTTTTASKTYYARTTSKTEVGISNYASTTNSNWTGYGWVYVSTFTVSRSTIKNSLKSTTPNWAKGDRYLPANDSYYCYSWTNSISRSSISYGYASFASRSASAYVTTARTYTSRASNYTKSETITVTNTISETETIQVEWYETVTSTSNNINV